MLPWVSAVVPRMKATSMGKAFLAVDDHHPHQVLGRHGVDLAAAQPRVDEGPQADLRQQAGLARRDVAVQVRDAALRQVVGLDAVFQREQADLRDQAPMAADHALQEAIAAEPVQALLLAIALAGGKHQGQIARLPALEEPRRQRSEQFVGRADADEA
jgi:hypothetical protein